MIELHRLRSQKLFVEEFLEKWIDFRYLPRFVETDVQRESDTVERASDNRFSQITTCLWRRFRDVNRIEISIRTLSNTFVDPSDDKASH